MQKGLIVVLSQTRAHELTYKSFERNLLNQFPESDLALCVTDSDAGGEVGGNLFYERAKFVWRCKEHDDWRVAYQELVQTHGIIADWDKFLNKKGNWLGGISHHGCMQPGSGAILLLMRLFLLDSLILEGLDDYYDYYIITRSDFIWTCPHPALDLLDLDSVWVPCGEAYGGITDRHIVFSKRYLKTLLNPLIYMFKINPGIFSKMDDSVEWNIERLLKFCYMSQGLDEKIRFFPYCMYLARERETHTRWSYGSHSIVHNYLIKYENEYKTASAWRFFVRSQDDWRFHPEYFCSEAQDYPHNTPLKQRSLRFIIFNRLIKLTYGDRYRATRLLRRMLMKE